MAQKNERACIAFDGHRRIASGTLAQVALAAKHAVDRGAAGPVLIFDNGTGRQVDVDFRGSDAEVVARLPATEEAEAPVARGPGRPKLGVVAREVTLLPRHWDWLSEQAGGASATLRRLVEEARRTNGGCDRHRQAGEALDRFMLAMAGDLPHYEEASRAFWRKERERFSELTDAWPADVREHVRHLANRTWDDAPVDA
ncbi:DUF2239 family protein [Dyella jiangningensis]|uniref:DUF2239 domain-containing protein n=1 Tax=Dyella jiangningensis TaxID=1379159 RepID=A0A328NVH9_9GAMM|nr:DUF2239 family protein [Dyella jiangningensis]RAO74450.1 hypothetical protein CA260_20460 [Dyella jiangningensis]